MLFGEFHITRCNKREEGCQLVNEAVHLYAQMELPAEAEARARARQLGCLYSRPPHAAISPSSRGTRTL
jgi:hypothetical protein